MRKAVKRVPFELLDDFSIYCQILKSNGLKENEIASILGKDRTTIIYHFKRYVDKKMVSKPFNRKIENFNEEKFIKKYKKTGLMNRFFNGISELPEQLKVIQKN